MLIWGLLLLVASVVVGVFILGRMISAMPGQSHAGPLPAISPRETALRDALRRDVETLAGRIGDRNVLRPDKLAEAADYIEAELQEARYAVERQPYPVYGVTCDNLIVELRGTKTPAEIVIVGAHYDSVYGCPAANDNASGVAGMLALARAFAGTSPGRTLRFVAFVNEEPPHFWTDDMGSLVYAKRCRERGEAIVGMISLETIGHYDTTRGSQQYPFPLSLLYPSTGDFIGFVGNTASGDFVRRVVGSFRRHAQFPSQGAVLPSAVRQAGWSDHWSFWQQGYPAMMVTDTAPFRYAHYHTRQDTPDKLDYERMARVVAGLQDVVAELTDTAE